MKQLLVTFTRTHRLPMPKPLPVVSEQEARQWFSGWWHGIALGCIVGIALGVVAKDAFAGQPTHVGVHVGSVHLSRAPAYIGEWNDVNPGVYARWGNGFTAGTLRNSERRQSVYAGWSVDGYPVLGLTPSLTLGAITGYGRGPSVLLAAGVSTRISKSTSARITWLPKANNYGSHALHLSFEWAIK